MYSVRIEIRKLYIEGLDELEPYCYGIIDIVKEDEMDGEFVFEQITDCFGDKEEKTIGVLDENENLMILTDVPEEVCDEFYEHFPKDWDYLESFENEDDAKAYCDKIKRIPFSEAKED